MVQQHSPLRARSAPPLTRAECLDRLHTARIGRVGLSIDALPVVLPVSYAILDDDVVFSSLVDAKVAKKGEGVVLAFQVDHFGGSNGQNWSVLVQGRAHEVAEPDELSRCRALSLPSHESTASDASFTRLSTTIITGRVFVDERDRSISEAPRVAAQL